MVLVFCSCVSAITTDVFICDYDNGNTLSHSSGTYYLNNVSRYNSTWLEFENNHVNFINSDSIRNNNLTQSWSYSMWLYFNDVHEDSVIFTKGKTLTGGTTEVTLMIDNENLSLYVYNSSDAPIKSTQVYGTPPINTWIHILLSLDAPTGIISLYVDGTLVNNETSSSDYKMVDYGQDLTIGKDIVRGGNYFFNGSIKDFKIWNESFFYEHQAANIYEQEINNRGRRYYNFMYHHVADTKDTLWYVSTSEFEKQMQSYNRTEFKVCTFDDYYSQRTKEVSALNQSCILLVFDDAANDVYTNATPIMDKYGFVGVIGIITDLVGTPGYTTWAQLDDLCNNKGWECASHSKNHSYLLIDNLTIEQFREQLSLSKQAIISNLSITPKTYIFPGNQWVNQTYMDICLEYYTACTGSSSGSIPKYLYEDANLSTEGMWRLRITNETTIRIIEQQFLYYDINRRLILDFAENSGTTVYDTSGNNNNGTITGATWNNDGIDVSLTTNHDFSVSDSTFQLLDTYFNRQELIAYYSCNIIYNNTIVNFTRTFCKAPYNNVTTFDSSVSSTKIMLDNLNSSDVLIARLDNLGTYNQICNSTECIEDNPAYNISINPGNKTWVFSYSSNTQPIFSGGIPNTITDINYTYFPSQYRLLIEGDGVGEVGLTNMRKSLSSTYLVFHDGAYVGYSTSDNYSINSWSGWNFTGFVPIVINESCPEDNSYENSDVSIEIETYNNGSVWLDWNRSLIIWSPFNDYANNSWTYDNSSYSHNITVVGANWTSEGYMDGAYDFTENNSYIQIANRAEFEVQEFTVSFWAKHDNYAGYKQGGVAKGHLFSSSAGYSWQIRFHLGNADIYISNGTDGDFDRISISDNNWHMWTGRVNSTHIEFFKDGVGSGTPSVIDINEINYSIANTDLCIGGACTENSNSIDGKIDDFLFFNRPLGDDEILNLYNSENRKYHHNFTNLTEGSYTWKAYIQDISGKANYTETRTVTYDSTFSGISNTTITGMTRRILRTGVMVLIVVALLSAFSLPIITGMDVSIEFMFILTVITIITMVVLSFIQNILW